MKSSCRADFACLARIPIGLAVTAGESSQSEDIMLCSAPPVQTLCLCGVPQWRQSCRADSSVRPGRTIVVGTDTGLYCRAQILRQALLIFGSVDEHGKHLGEHQLDLSQPRQLLE